MEDDYIETQLPPGSYMPQEGDEDDGMFSLGKDFCFRLAYYYILIGYGFGIRENDYFQEVRLLYICFSYLSTWIFCSSTSTLCARGKKYAL